MKTDFKATRAVFDLPEGIVYMDGNSLGPLPKTVPERLRAVEAEWGQMLISGWNKAGWMDAPNKIGDRLAKLIGAPEGTVVVGDTLSIKIYQALAAALSLNPDRKVILSDTGNFPTDLYMAEGLISALGQGHELRLVDPEDVCGAITSDIACLMLTEVDYRTGRRFDMVKLTQLARDAGVITIWDLAHSVGALPVDVSSAGPDFAVGCTYKYLNAGPGAPAFIFVAPDLIDHVSPHLSGWLGHQAPFAFEARYRPGTGIDRMRIGTPPVLQLAALDAALDVWDGVSMHDVREQAIILSDHFIEEIEKACPDLVLASPRNAACRGSHVSFRHEQGYAIMQSLIAKGVIGDFRAPDVMRFGFTPLYQSLEDIQKAADTLVQTMKQTSWDHQEYSPRRRVT